MKKQFTPRHITTEREMSTKTALGWFAIALLLAMMLSSCTTTNRSALPCYYFADKGGNNANY